MGFLRDKTTGAVSGDLDPAGDQYRQLVATKNYEEVSGPQAEAATSRFMAAVLAPCAVGVDNVELLADNLEDDIAVSAVTYKPDTTITGADTNSRTVAVVAGPDKASPISVASKAFTAGVNATGGAETAITLGTAAVPAGEPVVAKSTHVGTGIADPGGLLVATYTEA